ncbi:RagB/SusD family nutrient uptake outer membrane protein [Spirosoma montaniterrae]|uniref:Carbohydrate-binding protein SusD n=1 Tax=Spirosoma montaniterrae TaxID=1178516 RepID=A0A1P9WXA0_9BACT|nr:RagB/SusD family nutrient uptake outer membrane protein [Spirosoma montaniterrae]AQG80014.1 carbohydrate-binding protein SusD [Spirosoma montaniterrae]
MKRLIISRLSVLALSSTLIIAACNDNILETKPLDRISADATWADGALAQAFVFNVYSYLGYAGFEEQGLSAITDEAMFTHAGRNINTFTEGTETPGNLAWQSPTYEWGNMYLAIRQANIAIEQLPKATFTNQTLKDQLMGEAHFLRAHYYQQLVRFYGGVPLISKPYGLNEDYSVARSSYDDCIKFIVADLDKAAELLKGKTLEDGRTNRLAALALKARVLTYAASDLHDAAKVRAKVSVMASFSNPELVAYTSGDQASRWQAARTAAKAALDEAAAAGKGYKLNLAAPVTAAEGRANYNAIAMGGKSAAADPAGAIDLIWQRTHTPLFTQESNWPLGGIHYGINNGPNGYNNWAGNTPIQNLVDDFEMMDGSKFDWNNATHKAAPYDNRDPRFYASIMFDGTGWKPRPPAVAGIDPANQIQTGFYDDGKGGTINGVDTRESAVENWNGTRSGYYTRKFIDNDPALRDNQSSAQVIPFPFLRQTENVLNYVEACLNTGQEAEARLWLNRIRARAGMPPTTESGAALLARYQNERRIELQYEEHRYHDARRWLIAPTTVGRGIKSINVRATLRPGATPNVPYRFDRSKYNYTYTVADNTQNETRRWNDKMYYRPISRDEINRNTKLVQNPGY